MILLLLLLVSSGLFAQKQIAMESYEKQTEAENFVDLYYELQSAVYLEEGETKIYVEGGAVKVLYALDDLNRLNLSTADFLGSVELLVIKNKQSLSPDFLDQCTALRYVVFDYDGGQSDSSSFLTQVERMRTTELAERLRALVVLYRNNKTSTE